jgi:hypothetical protein
VCLDPTSTTSTPSASLRTDVSGGVHSGGNEEEEEEADHFFFDRNNGVLAAEGERKAMAEWTLSGPQPGRPFLTSLLFTFALAKVATEKWGDFPAEEETKASGI